ncbi:MAG: hypothetical protein WDM96_16545 [Lacunisphaera sp.]
MRPRLISTWTAALLLAVLSVRADEAADRWIAKARAYLGTEATLNAVRSLHLQGSFAGTEQVPDPDDAKKTVEQPVRVSIDIVFQQPMQQRQILRSDRIERVTGLDDYDAWERVADLTGKNNARLTLLDAPSIKRLRATTIENLSFYGNRGTGSRQVKLLGEETVDGVACVKISFSHGSNIVFLRYFEQATGRLVKTEVEGGGVIREEGEMIVSGVRFPKKVINQSAGGRSTTITFEHVSVNEDFPAATFAVPSVATK